MRLVLPFLLFFSLSGLSQTSIEKSIEQNPDSIRIVLLKDLEAQQAPESKLFHYLAKCYLELELFDSAVYFLKKERKLLSSELSIQWIKNEHLWGNSLYFSGQLTAADSVLSKTTSKLYLVTDYQLKSRILLDAGWYARETGKHTEALDYYHKAKLIAEQFDDPVLLGEAYSKIAVVYHVKREFESAQSNYDQALDLFQQEKQYDKIARLYNNYGLLYQYQGEYNKAVPYFEKSIEMCDSLNNQRGVAIANENLGILCYENLANNAMALNRFEQSLNYWRSINDLYGVAQTTVYKMYVYELQNQNQQIIDTGVFVLNLCHLSGAKDVEREALQLIAKAYERKGDLSNALSSYKRYYELNDSLNAINDLEEIKIMSIENNLASKQLQDSLELAIQHEQAQAEFDQKNKEQRIWIGLSLGAIMALAIIIFLVVKGSHQRKKASALIEETNLLLKTKNNEIIDSITYAQRIQSAILPSSSKRSKIYGEHFILFLPKDIVAGDFYWAESAVIEGKERLFFAVADCTGHGVPGAMVSVICSNALNKTVLELGIFEPAAILEKVTELVINTFNQDNDSLQDGMDISLISMTKNNDKSIQLEYSGANNPLWVKYKHRTEITEIKGTKRPVGKYDVQTSFVNHSLELSMGDTVYLFSDGYADQFGGEKSKKFKYKTLKELLLKISDKNAQEQEDELRHVFETWKGSLEQVDDVCVAGIKI